MVYRFFSLALLTYAFLSASCSKKNPPPVVQQEPEILVQEEESFVLSSITAPAGALCVCRFKPSSFCSQEIQNRGIQTLTVQCPSFASSRCYQSVEQSSSLENPQLTFNLIVTCEIPPTDGDLSLQPESCDFQLAGCESQ